MKVSKKSLGNGKTKVMVTVMAQDVTDKIDDLSQQYATALGITVEEGSWAHNELIALCGAEDTRKMIDAQIMKDAAEVAITMLGLDIVAKPRFFAEKPATEGQDFSFEAEVFDKPQYELTSYDPVEVTVPGIKVTEEEISDFMAREASQSAKAVADDSVKVARPGVEVELSMVSMQHGTVLESNTKDSYFYTPGEGLMPYDFDSQIIGMEVGETKEFDFMLPAVINEDGTQDAPTKTHCTVTLKHVMKQVLPEITDEWIAANVEGFETYDQYHKWIYDQLLEDKTNMHRQQIASACASKLGERLIGDLPDDIFQACLEDLKEEFVREAKQMGITMGEYQEKLGLNAQQFSMATMFQVEEQLKQTFALEALARHNGLTVEEEDYDKLYSLIAPGREGLAQSQFERNGRTFVVTEAALHAKANELLMDQAIIHVEEDAE